MSLLNNKWAIISLLLLVCTIIASLFAGLFYMQLAAANQQYDNLMTDIGNYLINVNVGVDYGNGTRVWSNDTRTVIDDSLLNVTKKIADVGVQEYSFGTLVTRINDKSSDGSYGWTYWVWNSTSSAYDFSLDSVTDLKVSNNQIYMWYYTNSFDAPTP